MATPQRRTIRATYAPRGYGWSERLRATQEARVLNDPDPARRQATAETYGIRLPEEQAQTGRMSQQAILREAQRQIDEEDREMERQREAQAKEAQRQRNAKFEAEARRTGRSIYKDEFGDWQPTESDEEFARKQQLEAQNAEREARYRKEGRQFFKDKTTGEVVPEISDEVFEAKRKTAVQMDAAERTARDAEEKIRYQQQLQQVNDAQIASEAAMAKKRLKEAEQNLAPLEEKERLRAEAKAAQDRLDQLTISKPERELQAIEQERQLRQTKQNLTRIGEDVKAGRSPDWYTPQPPSNPPQPSAPARSTETLSAKEAAEEANRQFETLNADVERHNQERQHADQPLTLHQQKIDRLMQENKAAIQSPNAEARPRNVPLPDGTVEQQMWTDQHWQQFQKLHAESREIEQRAQPTRERLDVQQQELQARITEANKVGEVAARKRKEERGEFLKRMRADPGMASAADEVEKLDADYERVSSQLRPKESEEDRLALEAVTAEYDRSVVAAIKAGEARQQAALDGIAKFREGQKAATKLPNGEVDLTKAIDYWRTELPKFAQQHGLTPKQASDMLEDHNKLTEDWNGAVFSGGDKTRILSNGRVVVNPALYAEPEKYKKAVESAEATPEAKAEALAMLPKLEKQALEAMLPHIRSAPGFHEFALKNGADFMDPGYVNLATWTPEEIAEAQAKSKFKDAAELVKAYRASPEGNRWWANHAHQAILGMASGTLGMFQQATGSYAALTGNEGAATLALDAGNLMQKAGQASQAMTSGQWTNKIAQGGTSIIPALAGGMGASALGRVLLSGRMATMTATEAAALSQTLGMSGSAAAAGLQSFGGTWTDAYGEYLKQGMTPDEARKKALVPAIASGLTTAAITYGFGAKGTEAVFAAEQFKKTGKELLRALAAGSGSEFTEETLDQAMQGIIAAMTYSPNKPLGDIISEALEAGPVGAVFGGGMTAITNASAPVQVNATGDVEGDSMAGSPAPGGLPPDLAPPPQVSNLEQTAGLAASDAEIERIAQADPTLAAQAEVVREIASGTPLSKLTDAQLSAVGVERNAKGEAMNVKPKQGEPTPAVKIENGQPIITQPVLDALEEQAPRTRALVTMDEVEARERISQQQTESPAPTVATESGAEATGEPRGSSPQAGAVPAVSGMDTAAEGAAEASPADAAPVTPDQPADQPTIAPPIAPDEAQPGEVLREPQAPGASIDQQVMQAAAPLVLGVERAAGKNKAAAIAGRAKLLATVINQSAPNFATVRFATAGPTQGPAALAPDGALEIDVPKLLQTMTAKGVKDARVWLESVVDEEFEHRVSTEAERRSPQFAADLKATYEALPDSLKEMSRATYFAQVDSKGKKNQFENDFQARHEFIRQYRQKAKFRKLTEASLAQKGMLPTLRRLIAGFIKELRRIQKGAKHPQIKARLDAIASQLDAIAAELKGVVETPASTQSETVQAKPERLEQLAEQTKNPALAETLRKKAEAIRGKEKATDVPKSSTQLTLDSKQAQQVLVFAQEIPDADLYSEKDENGKEDYGRETQPHVTVLYGLTQHDPKKAAKFVEQFGPITVTLGKTSLFENEKYDVLKVEVEGADLRKLNAQLRKLPNENKFPDYKPHMTIAYLKKGEGKKYVGDTRFEGREITFDSVTFSPPSGMADALTQSEMPLGKPSTNDTPQTPQAGQVSQQPEVSQTQQPDEAVGEVQPTVRAESEPGEGRESADRGDELTKPTKKKARKAALETPAQAVEKVEEHVDNVAKTEGQRDANEVKKELVQRIESAIADLKTGRIAESGRDTITIEIPGDGTFTLFRNLENLEAMLKKAKALQPTPKATIGPVETVRKNAATEANLILNQGMPSVIRAWVIQSVNGDEWAMKVVAKMKEKSNNVALVEKQIREELEGSPRPAATPRAESKEGGLGTAPTGQPETPIDGTPSELLGFTPVPLSSLSADERQRLTLAQSYVAGHPRTRGQGIIVRTVSPNERGAGGSRAAESVGALLGFLDGFQSVTGRRVIFIDSSDGSTLPFSALSLPRFPDTIFINARAQRAAMALVGHEWSHTVSRSHPELYKAFYEAVLPNLDGKELADASKALREIGYDEGSLLDEHMSNIVGDAFMQPDFWKDLKASNKPLWSKVFASVVRFLDQMLGKAKTSEFGTEKMIKDMQAVRRAVVDLMNGSVTQPAIGKPTATANVDFSLSTAPADQSDDEIIAALTAHLSEELPSDEELQALQEFHALEVPGEYTIGDPDIANPGQTEAQRKAFNVIREVYADTILKKQSAADLDKAARKRATEDPKGVQRAILEAYSRGEPVSNLDTRAAAHLYRDLMRDAMLSGDPAKMREASVFALAYIGTGTEQGRALAARRDTTKTRQERFDEFIAEAISQPQKIEDKLAFEEAPTAAEKSRTISRLNRELAEAEAAKNKAGMVSKTRQRDAEKKRPTKEDLALKFAKEQRDAMKKALAREGLTLEDVLEGRVSYRMKFGRLVMDAMGQKDPQREKAIDLIVHGWSTTEISRATKLSTDAVAKIRDQLRNRPRALVDAIKDMLRRGIKVTDIAASLSTAPTGAGMSDADLETEALRILDILIPTEQQASRSRWKKVRRPRPVTDKTPNAILERAISRLERVTGPRSRPSDMQALIHRHRSKRVSDFVFQAVQLGAEPELAREADAAIEKARKPARPTAEVDLDWEYVPFDLNDKAQTYRVMRTMSESVKGAFDMVTEFWINSILSGPQTHAVNMVGNAASALWDMTFQRAGEMAVGTALRAVGKGDAVKNTASIQEIAPMIKGILPGIMRGWTMATEAWSTEKDLFDQTYLNTPEDVEEELDRHGPTGAIKGRVGRVIRVPGRALRAVDNFFKSVISNIEVGAQAHRLGVSKGLSGEALQEFIAMEAATPGSMSWVMAVEKAKELTFQDESVATMLAEGITRAPGRASKMMEGKALVEARKGNQRQARNFVRAAKALTFTQNVMRFIFPFVRTPTNIIRMGLRKSPVGSVALAFHLMKGLRAGVKGQGFFNKYPAALLARHLTEQAFAWTGMALLLALSEGDDDDDKKRVLLVGGRPYSQGRGTSEADQARRLYGGTYMLIIRDRNGNVRSRIMFGRIEPFATALGGMVDAARAIKMHWREGNVEEANRIKKAVASNLLGQMEDKTFMRGIGDVTRAFADLTDPESKGGAFNRYGENLLAGFVPNIIKQPLRNLDPVQRNYKQADTVETGVLSLNKHVFWPDGRFANPMVDLFGQDVEKSGSPLIRVFWPTPDKVHPEASNQMLEAWNREHPVNIPGDDNKRESRYLPLRADNRYYKTEGEDGKDRAMTRPEMRVFDKAAGGLFRKAQSGVTPQMAAKPQYENIADLKKNLSAARKLAKREVAVGADRQ